MDPRHAGFFRSAVCSIGDKSHRCFPSRPRRLSALGPVNLFGEIAAALKISFLAVEVCARSGVFKQPPGSGVFDRKEAGVSIRGKISR